VSVFAIFKELIQKGEYFKAHEVLEEEWQKIKKSKSNLSFIYKGFINAAVAFELKKRNRDSYKKAWRGFEKYKKNYLKDKEAVEIMKFLEEKRNGLFN